jgi:hypothetical protein
MTTVTQTMNQASDTDGHIREVQILATGDPPDISAG